MQTIEIIIVCKRVSQQEIQKSGRMNLLGSSLGLGSLLGGRLLGGSGLLRGGLLGGGGFLGSSFGLGSLLGGSLFGGSLLGGGGQLVRSLDHGELSRIHGFLEGSA